MDRHLERIKDAITLLPDPAGAPPQASPCMKELGQDLQAEDSVFKKSGNGGINGELLKQLAGLERQLEEQTEASKALQA
ncbi:hypothetical protein LTR84_004168 [Exophiala bonariae]|uniref:Mediator of RNA polymerase II transcription subunit 9 n=1 Tax=Exophiala bonariae TaxID=1690606 RepID=A0AAV9N5W1_9EURO|nr:hypothetical protein LTR84_004168 [Exophiala bonariae]